MAILLKSREPLAETAGHLLPGHPTHRLRIRKKGLLLSIARICGILVSVMWQTVLIFTLPRNNMQPLSPRAKPNLGMERNKPPIDEAVQSLVPRGVIERDLRVDRDQGVRPAQTVEAGLTLVINPVNPLEVPLLQAKRIAEFASFI